MPKKLTEEEKQLRKWQKDEKLEKVVDCNCGKRHEFIARYSGYFCKCGRNLIYMYSVNHRNCKEVYSREGLSW